MLSFYETIAFIFSIGHTPKHLVPAHLLWRACYKERSHNIHPEKLIYK